MMQKFPRYTVGGIKRYHKLHPNALWVFCDSLSLDVLVICDITGGPIHTSVARCLLFHNLSMITLNTIKICKAISHILTTSGNVMMNNSVPIKFLM